MFKTLVKVAADKRIAHVDDERRKGNSLIVTTAAGHAWDASEREHVRGFDTIKEVLLDLRDVEPCSCAECLEMIAKGDK